MKIIPIIDVQEQVRQKLEAKGFTGLYLDGECGCEIGDLMPCGIAETDEGAGEFVNGCCGGYKHVDPEHPEVFIITLQKETPDADDWEIWRNSYNG